MTITQIIVDSDTPHLTNEFDYQLTAAQAYAGNVALHNSSFVLTPKMISEDLQRYVLHIHRDKQGRVQVYGKTAATSGDYDIELAKKELSIMVAEKDEHAQAIVNACPQTVPLGTTHISRSTHTQLTDDNGVESVSSLVDKIDSLLADTDSGFIKVQQLTDRDMHGQYTPVYWGPSDLIELVKSGLFTYHRASLLSLIESVMCTYGTLFELRNVGVVMRQYNLVQALRLTFQNLQSAPMGTLVGLKATAEVMVFVPEFERSQDLQDGRGVALSVSQSVIL